MYTKFLNKKWLIIILIMLFPLSLMSQNKSTLRGKVMNTKLEPIADASVVVGNSESSTLTDAQGIFTLQAPNHYPITLTVLSLGYETKKSLLSAQPSEGEITIVLQEEDVELDEVLIVANRSDVAYAKTKVSMGGKLNGTLQELPQSVSIINQKLMIDKQAFQVADIIQGLSGVTQSSSYDDVTIRGFRNGYENGLRLVNGLRSGYGYGTSYFRSPLTINLESIEVVKGPSSSLFGDIAPGGTINMVTKKPLSERNGRISIAGGSFQTWRTTLDIGGPLDKNKKILYRLNVGYEYAKTFRDINTRKNMMIAPSFSFRPADGTQVDIDLVYDNFDGYLDRGMGIKGKDWKAMPRSFTISQPSDFFKTNTYTLSGRWNQRIVKNLHLNLSYMSSIYEEDLNEHRTLNSFADPGKNTIMNLRFLQRNAKDYTQNLVAYLKWDSQFGKWNNSLTVGSDYGQYKGAKESQHKEARSKMVDGEVVPLTFDLNNPTYQIQDLSTYVWRDNMPFPFLSPNHTWGVYFINQLSFKERLNIILGLRHEKYHSKSATAGSKDKATQNVWLPRIGLNYALTNNLRYFASYSQGYIPLAVDYVANYKNYGSNKPFKSETSYQIETGLKTSWFNKRLLIDLSLFHIERRNMMSATGDTSDEGFPIYRQSGKAISQGVEVEVRGLITRNLSVDANYTFNKTEVKSSSMAAEDGLSLPGAPRNTANVWLKYEFETTFLRGLGIGAGMRYVDNRRMENPTGTDSQGNKTWDKWPAYTTVDMGVYYQIDQFNLALNINNLLDKFYFLGGYDYTRGFPGTPRSIMATVSYAF